jgi:hypothetical protein
MEPCLSSLEGKHESAEKNEPKRRNKLAGRAIVRVILIASMMKRVNQRMEGKRSKSYE